MRRVLVALVAVAAAVAAVTVVLTRGSSAPKQVVAARAVAVSDHPPVTLKEALKVARRLAPHGEREGGRPSLPDERDGGRRCAERRAGAIGDRRAPPRGLPRRLARRRPARVARRLGRARRAVLPRAALRLPARERPPLLRAGPRRDDPALPPARG